MMATCPVCGKLTAIYWPEFWVYRRGETFYCSENCKMVDQTQGIKLINQVARDRRIRKGVESMGKHRLTLEQKKKAVEIASQGGNQLAYLKKCGAKNPSAAWYYIQKTIMDKAPEEPEEMEDLQAEKPILAEVAEKVPEVEGLKPKMPEDGQGINFMTKQEHKAAHKGIKNEGTLWPPPPGGFYISQDIKVTRFETNFGKFSETETGRIQAEIKTGTSVTVIILKKEEWIQLMVEIEAAMKIFAGGQ